MEAFVSHGFIFVLWPRVPLAVISRVVVGHGCVRMEARWQAMNGKGVGISMVEAEAKHNLVRVFLGWIEGSSDCGTPTYPQNIERKWRG